LNADLFCQDCEVKKNQLKTCSVSAFVWEWANLVVTESLWMGRGRVNQRNHLDLFLAVHWWH